MLQSAPRSWDVKEHRLEGPAGPDLPPYHLVVHVPLGIRSRLVQLVAVAAILQLLAAVGALGLVREPPLSPSPSAVHAPVQEADRLAGAAVRLQPDVADPDPPTLPATTPDPARGGQVERLLQARSAAVLDRDRAAFLATVDPRATALMARQAAMFDALAAVPLASWDYTLDLRSDRPADSALDLRYGRGQWWAPEVSLSYALAGFDDRPSTSEQHVTFVRRGGRWLLGADDDFDAAGDATPRALWERGPIVTVRAAGVLVLGHRDTSLLRNVASQTAASIPRVTAVWGSDWSRQVVVLVPTDAAEFASLLKSTQDFSQIAAVATAEYSGPTSADGTATDRILVNPDTFAKLGMLGRRVVLTHEVTHVASRRASGPLIPAWLAEGFADYLGYKGVKVPLEVAARELRKDVRAGRLPTALPADDAFSGNNPELAQAYEQSWLAVRLLVQNYGEAAVLSFYQEVGASRSGPESLVLATELDRAFGLDLARLTADWRAALQRQFG